MPQKQARVLLAFIFQAFIASAGIPNCILGYLDGFVPVLLQMEAPTATIAEVHATQYATSDLKAQALMESLQAFSRQSQTEFLRFLDRLKAKGEVAEYRTYYISNTVAVELKNSIIHKFASYTDVKAVGCNFVQANLMRRDTTHAKDAPIWFIASKYGVDEDYDLTKHPLHYGPGIHRMNAHDIDEEIVKKAGELVFGIQDSGFDFNHPALAANYKGNHGEAFSHDFNWFDSTQKDKQTSDTISPDNDSYGHGTAVLSLAVGKRPVGISPESKWIACKSLVGESNPTEMYLACQKFLLAPTNLKGEHPLVALRPHVIANAWASDHQENCLMEPFVYTTYAHHVAGIFNTFASGNRERWEACGSIEFPPPKNKYSFVVAALKRSSDTRRQSSSLGPSPLRENVIDVAVTGEIVLMAHPGSKYAYASGTSYSAPLVAGGALLVIAACPHLQRNPDGLANVLRESATPLYSKLGCGGDTKQSHPNNEFGYGSANIKKAIALCKRKETVNHD